MKTAKEFNEKYKEYIEKGFDGLEFSDERVINFLDEQFQDFIKIPGFQYSQIKLKFGMTRFYSTLSTKEMFFVEDRINELLKGEENDKS